MRVTYLHQYFNTPSMAGSTRSYEMARRLVLMGHEVSIVTSWRKDNSRGKDWFVTQEDGITVHWLPLPYSNRLTYRQRIHAFLRFAWAAGRRAAALPADIVFATSTPLTIALPAVYAAKRQAVAMVFEVRDLWPELPIAMGALNSPLLRGLARALEKFSYRHSKAVIALSPGMRDGVAATGYPIDRITVIPNSADLDRFFPDAHMKRQFRRLHDIGERDVLVVYAGTLGRINGVSYLVDLAAALSEVKNVRFLIVGDGQEAEQIRAYAAQRGCLGLNFHMMPEVSKAEIAGVFAAADIAVSTIIPLPELEANSANKFFDGLAAGCCVAVNHGGWQADLLREHQAGFQLPRAIDQAAAELMDWALQPERIATAGQRARMLAERLFSRDLLARELERVLMRSAGNRMSQTEQK